MSKCYPVNYEEEYALLVEGRNPHENCGPTSSRWRRNVNLCPRSYHRSYPSGVIYCNPKFSAGSSQATLAYEGELDDSYGRGIAAYSVMVAQKYPYCLKAPDAPRLLKGSVKDERPMYCDYGNMSPRSSSNRRLYEHPQYPKESVTDDEISVEDSDSPRPILKNSKRSVRNDGKGNLQSTYSMEKMVRNLNNLNKHTLGGRKLKPEDVRMITERLRGRQHANDQYVCNRSRFLNKSYEQAAKVLKGAQTKATLGKKEEPSDSYSVTRFPYDTTKNSQLRIDHRLSRRQLAVSSDRHGHIFLGSQRLIQQVSPQFAVLNQAVCSAIPEEQPETTDLKSTEIEHPVKLQKEGSVTIEFSSTEITRKRSSQIRKGRGSIIRTSRRNRRVNKRPLAVCTYTQFVQKLIATTEATVYKDSGHLQEGQQKSNPVAPSQRSEPKPSSNSPSQQIQAKPSSVQSNPASQFSDPKPHSVKSSLKVEVSEMLTKLEEIQKLLSKNKASSKELDVVQELLDTSDRNLSSVFTSELTVSRNDAKPSKHVTYSVPIPEKDEAGSSSHNVKSHDPVSILSTQSAIMSLLSSISKKLVSNKSYDNEATDAQIFQDIFHSEEESNKKQESKIPLSKKGGARQMNSPSIASSTSTVYPLPRGNLQIPKHSAPSVVTVFPIETRVNEQPQVTKPARKRIGKVGKRYTAAEKPSDSSSDNLDEIKVRRRKQKAGSPSTTPGDSILRPSVLSSLNSALCIIIGFLFRYLKSLFIL
uniref:Uncharacterized protein n=1 Tax=Photinus pyralis TaxID=7054 RepID=A0A1Y1MT79_PHOPY